MPTNTSKQSIQDIDLSNQRIIMRVDYNVPQDKKDPYKITDDTRITATLPTIRYLKENGAKSIVLVSHLGRPDGKRVEKYSLKPVAQRLEQLLGDKIVFLSELNNDAIQASQQASGGQILLLENIRFYPEEEAKKVDDNVKAFREKLSKLGDVYVNDAFGTSHRAHSSMVGVNGKHKVAGLLLAKELDMFGTMLNNPKKPFLAILGGAKVKDKIQLIGNLLDKVDEMIIVGGMVFTFKSTCSGIKIGKSLFDKEGAEIVEELMEKAEKKGVKVHFPIDYRCNTDFAECENPVICTDKEGGIPENLMGLDIGPESEKLMANAISQANTILWNGPAGVFEMKAFAKGSEAMLDAVVARTKQGAVSIVGGGDTGNLVVSRGKEDGITHVSTGGGASLELCEGKVLPGVQSLDDKQ
eukprot:CAMPEP_0117448748 /NCGR_PEP_ID=MMETSP0759-20121206/7569_1 /TAXON_ID=63605 /ORGANISM="Percolomonas cosmopolitus, Strain WS" /LENGTH=411 /DNA_ID=CAMNT_0005241161 /DNA_START=50 /DNA_END=1285 /DNA_ORIENTATION=+